MDKRRFSWGSLMFTPVIGLCVKSWLLILLSCFPILGNIVAGFLGAGEIAKFADTEEEAEKLITMFDRAGKIAFIITVVSALAGVACVGCIGACTSGVANSFLS